MRGDITILLVEDEPLQCTLMQRILARFFPAARVTTTNTGYEMLTAYQDTRPALIILDNRLPDILGTTLITYLRETGTTVPILLLTACLPADMPPDPYTVYLQKPAPFLQLVPTITTLLQVGGTSCGDPTRCICVLGQWCPSQRPYIPLPTTMCA